MSILRIGMIIPTEPTSIYKLFEEYLKSGGGSNATKKRRLSIDQQTGQKKQKIDTPTFSIHQAQEELTTIQILEDMRPKTPLRLS